MRWALLLAVASLAGAGFVAADERAAAVTQGALKLRAPAPGDLAVGVVKLHGTSKAAIAAAAKPLRISLAKALPGVVVLTAVHTVRTAGAATRTVLFIVANRGKRALSDEIPVPPDKEVSYLAVLALQLTGVWIGDDPVIAVPEYINGQHVDVHGTVLESELQATPAQRKEAAKLLNDLYTSPVPASAGQTLSDPNLDTGWYDDGHSLGWKQKAAAAKAIIKDAWVDLTVPQGASVVPEEVARVDAEIDAASGKQAPPPKQQLFAYAFSGLQISWDGPNDPNIGRTHVTAIFAGAGCGTPESSDWKGTYQVASLGSPLNLAWSAGLMSGTPVQIYTWSDRQGGPTGPVLGSVQINLLLTAGSPPTMGIRSSQNGDIANVAVAPDTAVTAKPVASC